MGLARMSLTQMIAKACHPPSLTLLVETMRPLLTCLFFAGASMGHKDSSVTAVQVGQRVGIFLVLFCRESLFTEKRTIFSHQRGTQERQPVTTLTGLARLPGGGGHLNVVRRSRG